MKSKVPLFFLFCTMSHPAMAALLPLERPDPATLKVPEINTPAKSDAGRFDDQFFFYKSGVSYARAFADMDQCRINVAMARMFAPTPRFVPLGRALETPAGRSGWELFPMFGLGGMLLADAFIAGAEDDLALATARKCMAYKGYRRYGLSRGLSKQIDSGTDAEKLGRRALIASGPLPQAEVLEP